jgi:thymidine kinase
MSLNAKPFVQGKFTVISGPVQSEKTEKIESFLDAVVDSGYKQDSNILIFRHPMDDPNPEYIGRHKAIVTHKVEDIYNNVKPSTRTAIILGASHFPADLVELTNALVRSNRDVITSVLNLDSECYPHGTAPGLMALADEVILAKAICSHPLCTNEEANRSSSEQGKFLPLCTHHYHYHNAPPIPNQDVGTLELFLGPMFSGKSTAWRREQIKMQRKGVPYVVFKWKEDVRYGEKEGKEFEEGQVTLHSGGKISAIMVKDAFGMETYLHQHKEIREVFPDEIQFFPGVFGMFARLLGEGYHFHGTGLPRGYNRQGFNDVPKLMCLADKINMHYAICVKCGDPATENQRINQADKSLVKVGGAGDYEARCLKDWTLDGEPELKYKFEKFGW